MTDRRDFLKGAAGAALIGPGIAGEVQAIVRGGRLGRITFCRVPDAAWLPLARSWSGEDPDCVFEVDASAECAAILGENATLTVTRGGCRVYAREA